MISLITAVIILASVVLAFFILVQSPKGGGLTGNFGSISTQVMGVKQSSDVMEKGTWATMGIIAALCIVTVMFIERPTRPADNRNAPAQQNNSAPANNAPAAGQTPAPAQPQGN